MRAKPELSERACMQCGDIYKPTGTCQKYCPKCKADRKRECKLAYWHRKNPDAKPKKKRTDVCCICGGPFSGEYGGKPYCNKHWQRMYHNGTVEPKTRNRTCEYLVDGELLVVRTHNGETILADAEDHDRIAEHSWCISKTGYAVSNIRGKVVKMHRFILGFEQCEGKIVDHKNHNKLDNRKENLRICTAKENARNTSVSKNNKVGVLGVRKVKSGKYEARIVADRTEYSLGYFETLEQAAAARKTAEEKYHGEFASHRSI